MGPADNLPDLQPAGTYTRMEWLPVVLALVIFSSLSIVTGFSSHAFLEADGCMHYLYSRFALAEPYRLVDVWGRPFCTTLYAIPAAFAGRTGTRLTSLVLALVVAWLAMRIARRQGYRWPALAMVFTLAQPLVFAHSFSELTELPFALLIGGAFLAYQSKRFGVMAVLVSLMPLARPEGFGVVLIAFFALIIHRRWLAIPLLLLGLVIWTHAGWVLFGREGSWWRWLPDHWPYAAASTYKPGYLLHFVAALPAVVSPLVFPGTVAGIVLCLRQHWTDHRGRCELFIAIIPLGVLAVHSLLYWRGLMASNGELRYLLTVAPFWGVLSARGWTWLAERFESRRPYTWAAIACLVPILANVYLYKVFPLKIDENWRIADAIAGYVRSHRPTDDRPLIMASHPGVFYCLDVSPTDGSRVCDLNADTIAHPPPRTRLIWDSVYGQYNADRSRIVSRDAILAAGWIPDEEVQKVIDAVPRGQENPSGWDARFRIPPAEWLAFRSPKP